MIGSREGIVVLLASFAFFGVGLWALYGEAGAWRMAGLWISFIGLGSIALRQTLKKRKK